MNVFTVGGSQPTTLLACFGVPQHTPACFRIVLFPFSMTVPRTCQSLPNHTVNEPATTVLSDACTCCHGLPLLQTFWSLGWPMRLWPLPAWRFHAGQYCTQHKRPSELFPISDCTFMSPEDVMCLGVHVHVTSARFVYALDHRQSTSFAPTGAGRRSTQLALAAMLATNGASKPGGIRGDKESTHMHAQLHSCCLRPT